MASALHLLQERVAAMLFCPPAFCCCCSYALPLSFASVGRDPHLLHHVLYRHGTKNQSWDQKLCTQSERQEKMVDRGKTGQKEKTEYFNHPNKQQLQQAASLTVLPNA